MATEHQINIRPSNAAELALWSDVYVARTSACGSASRNATLAIEEVAADAADRAIEHLRKRTEAKSSEADSDAMTTSSGTTDPQPQQPLVTDAHGVVRFRSNAILCWLVDTGRCNLNEIAMLPGIPVADRRQLAQLVGYSASGYGDLSYVDDAEWERVHSAQVAHIAAELASAKEPTR